MVEPIRVPCEGSDCPAHLVNYVYNLVGICAMCGAQVACGDDGRARPHDRNDILAMLDRGDFG